MATLIFDFGSRVQVSLGQLIFSIIADFKSGMKKNKKLSFPYLIFGLFYGQKPIIESNEYLTMQPIQFKIKKDDLVEGEEGKGNQSAKKKTKAAVVRMPAESVATEPETQSSSMPISSSGLAQSFF